MSYTAAVASRVVPRLRWSKKDLRYKADEALRRSELAKKAGYPETVNLIATDPSSRIEPDTGAAIRPYMHSRRVFLLQSHLKPEEIEGLAYRMRSLSKAEYLNSVLITMGDEDQDFEGLDWLPHSLHQRAYPKFDAIELPDLDPEFGKTYHFAGGYDPLAVYERGDHKDPERVKYILNAVRLMSETIRGNPNVTRIPLITLPHGRVSDSGYALCMGGYVLASTLTSFSIENPSRGLSFDPVGFSYLLPRLGRAHDQQSGKYPGCGLVLALSGYVADSEDMIDTGLATHLISNVNKNLPKLEENLAHLDPYNLREVIKQPTRFYGQPFPPDSNAIYRNSEVANVIHEYTDYAIDPEAQLNLSPRFFPPAEDPAFDLETSPIERTIYDYGLVEIAGTFDEFFRKEGTPAGLLERLRAVSGEVHEDEEEKLVSKIAGDLVERIEAQSPLAVSAVYRLMRMGNHPNATWEACMDREQRVQARMMAKPDFANWAEHAKHSEKPFTGWKDASIADVSPDEIKELFSEEETDDK